MTLHKPGVSQYGNASCKVEFGGPIKGWHETGLGCVPYSTWTWQSKVILVVMIGGGVSLFFYTVYHLIKVGSLSD